MPRMSRVKVIAALRAIPGVEFDANAEYKDLVLLLQEKTLEVEPEPVEPKKIEMTAKWPKRNTFLPDPVRDDRDTEFLNKELRKREHKGKVVRVTRIKEYEVIDGFWITRFIIEVRE